MITWRFEETIERPAMDVWQFAADVTRHHQWMGGENERLVSGSATQAGGRIMADWKLGPRVYQTELEVGPAEPGKRIGWRVVRGAPFLAEFVLDLQPIGADRTRVIWSGFLEPQGLWRLAGPLLAREAKEGERRELVRLKQAVEALPATATAAV